MPLPKNYVGFQTPVLANPRVIIEATLDLTCPFSKKAFVRLTEIVKGYENQVQFRVLNFVQPWHPQGWYLAQAAVAASLQGDGSVYWKMMAKLYEQRETDWIDEHVGDLSRNQIHAKLAGIAADLGLDKDQFTKDLTSDAVLQTLKCHQKYARQNGIHVTPTFLVNGVIEPSASSSWSAEQWDSLILPLLQTP